MGDNPNIIFIFVNFDDVDYFCDFEVLLLILLEVLLGNLIIC